MRREFKTSLLRWLDAEAGIDPGQTDANTSDAAAKKVDWPRIVPFVAVHLACLGVIWVGWSPAAVWTAVLLYLVRMFAITGFYHRYFSHKAFKTGRGWQFFFAVLGNAAAQRGPLWWAGHHRHHHRFVDTEKDVHSPSQHGFWWSHMGWLTSRANFATPYRYVKEWQRFPELVWLNRFDTVVPMALAVALYGWGAVLQRVMPAWGTSGAQMVVWGFFVSTVVLFHATCTINSLDHMIGTRRFDTPDTSRNNALLALITLGEGWHNNHHYYAVSARQGFRWWEIDITYGLLKLMALVGIVRDLRPLPQRLRSG